MKRLLFILGFLALVSCDGRMTETPSNTSLIVSDVELRGTGLCTVVFTSPLKGGTSYKNNYIVCPCDQFSIGDEVEVVKK